MALSRVRGGVCLFSLLAEMISCRVSEGFICLIVALHIRRTLGLPARRHCPPRCGSRTHCSCSRISSKRPSGCSVRRSMRARRSSVPSTPTRSRRGVCSRRCSGAAATSTRCTESRSSDVSRTPRHCADARCHLRPRCVKMSLAAKSHRRASRHLRGRPALPLGARRGPAHAQPRPPRDARRRRRPRARAARGSGDDDRGIDGADSREQISRRVRVVRRAAVHCHR